MRALWFPAADQFGGFMDFCEGLPIICTSNFRAFGFAVEGFQLLTAVPVRAHGISSLSSGRCSWLAWLATAQACLTV